MVEILRGRLARLMLSAVIVFVLVAQSSMIVLKLVGAPANMWYWPIIDYPMYEFAHYEGEYVMAYYFVEVSLKDDTVEKVTHKELGLSLYPYMYLARALSKGKENAVKRFVALYGNSAEVASIQVYTPPLIITKHGAERAPAKLLRAISLSEQPLAKQTESDNTPQEASL